MSRLFCLALMLFGLGACSETGEPTLMTIRDGNCGEIVLSGNPPRISDRPAMQTASACFVRAFQKCATTTLTIREPNNLVRQFAVSPASPCNLRQVLQTDSNAPPAVADCKSARLENNAFIVEACSHLGDFILTP